MPRLRPTHAWPAAQVPLLPTPALRPVQMLVIAFVHVPLLPTPQHGPLSAPQAPHWLPIVATRQAFGAVHMLPAQHCCPTPPHAVHVPGMPMPALRPVQTLVIVFVHVPLLPTPQHGPLSAPQAPHWLPPVATTQLFGAVHMFMAQHCSPAPPQAVHMPGVPIAALRPVQALVIVLVHVPLLPTPQQEAPR